MPQQAGNERARAHVLNLLGKVDEVPSSAMEIHIQFPSGAADFSSSEFGDELIPGCLPSSLNFCTIWCWAPPQVIVFSVQTAGFFHANTKMWYYMFFPDSYDFTEYVFGGFEAMALVVSALLVFLCWFGQANSGFVHHGRSCGHCEPFCAQLLSGQ